MKWSPYRKSSALQLDSAGIVAEHGGSNTTAWLSVCADKWFTRGINTFEVTIQGNVSNWIFIGMYLAFAMVCLIFTSGPGVAARSWKAYSDQTSGYVGQSADSWSYGSYPSWGKTHNHKNEAYGAAYVTGDVV